MKSGVRQGCILLPILFLVVINWVMWETTTNKPRGTQWTLFSQTENLDFANDLAFLSVKLDHPQEQPDRLDSYAKQTGLTFSTTKTQVMSINATPTAHVTLNGEPFVFVQDLMYLGSVTSKDNGAQKDIKARVVSPNFGTFGSASSIP